MICRFSKTEEPGSDETTYSLHHPGAQVQKDLKTVQLTNVTTVLITSAQNVIISAN